jgi:peptide/nickel transport system ATP-binding protein
VPDPEAARNRILLTGDVPSPINPPKGCRFHTRCPKVFDRCLVEEPALRPLAAGHLAACHLLDQKPDAGVKQASATGPVT